MTNVRVTCTECDGEGYTEYIKHPFGGYGPNHTEPDYRQAECEKCGGDGKETITRAEHLARSLAKMEAKRYAKWEAEFAAERKAQADAFAANAKGFFDSTAPRTT